MAVSDILKSFELFRGVTEDQLSKIAAIAREESHKEGSSITKESAKAEKLYLITEGKVILNMGVQPDPHRTATLATVDVIQKGEPFNWSSLIEPHICTLSAVCIAPVKVVAIDGPKLLGLMDEDPALGYQVMKRIAAVIGSRLRHTRQTLISERGLALI